MNHTYRLVWNQATQRYVPAPECAKGKGKTKALAPAAVILSTVLALPAWAQTSAPAPAANQLPTGGQVVSGSAHIHQSGSQMQIQQGSHKTIIDWSSFNIGKDAAVTFQQPDTSAIALNRVTAGDASHIHGQLNANGQVWLINPNGIVFGQGSQVDVGGLVASTMNITNADFENGHYSFTRNGASGSITNQGSITAQDGGSIALLAPTVSNDGILRAQLGTVAMAAGEKITLQAGANGLLNVEIDPATIRTLVENKQLIVAGGGQVIMTGKAADALSSSVVSNTGTIQANRLQERDGKILLIADMQHGETQAAGTIEAHFIDTSAATVSIDKDLKINTAGGQWLIDPVDITIDTGKATAIETALDTGDVTVSTSNNADNTSWNGDTNGTGSDKGDIHVNADITYAQNKLTLNADNDINLNAAIYVNGSGTLALNYGGTQGYSSATPATGSSINASFGESGGFAGKVNFAQSGAGLLAINGHDHTVIKDVAALQNMQSNLNGKYALGGDVDASSIGNFTPIGSDTHFFTGTFDGLGHRIRNLSVQVQNPDSGLFGTTGGSAQIRNVGLENASVNNQRAGGKSVGALVGYNQGQISNSWSSGNISADEPPQISGYSRVGGLVGYNMGSIYDSHSSANVTVQGRAYGTRNYAGGLVGHSGGGSIERSHASGAAVSRGGNYGHAGGLAGALSGSGTIKDSYATGNATARDVWDNVDIGAFAGGLVGWSSGTIQTSYACGNAWADAIAFSGPYGDMTTAGGLVGYNAGSVHDSYATGNATLHISYGYTYDYAGGLVGYNAGNLNHVYATGRAGFERTDAYAYAGGLVGGNNGTIANAYYATTDAAGSTINNGGATGTVYKPYVTWSGNAFGTRKTRTELMNPGLYTGWDSSIWNLPKGEAGEGYEIGLPALTGVTRSQDLVRSTWFDGGWGTDSSPYGIARWEQLSNMRLLLDKHYRLNDDLDSSTDGYTQHASATANGGAGFRPIGADTSTPFTGTLDGQGHAISDLVVKTSGGTGQEVHAGLFGVVSGGAKISNLGLINATVSASGGSHNYAGAVAGSVVGKAEISRSYANGGSVSVSTDGSANAGQFIGGRAGGLVGKASGMGLGAGLVMTDSYASNEVSSLGNGFNVSSYAGGLMGILEYGSVTRSYASGMVSASGSGTTKSAGGLVGSLQWGTIEHSYASGNVSATGGNMNLAGGLTGINGGNIFRSYAAGSVSVAGGSYNRSGGLIGSNNGGALVSHSFYATKNMAGFDINNGGAASGEWSSNALGTPKTWDELKQASTFAAWGSDLATHAGSSAIWRIYDGNTLPLLRSWLKPKTVTVSVQDLPTDIEYNGAAITGSLTANGYDGTGVEGDLDNVLSYSTTSKNAGTYSTQDGSLQLLGSGLYSDQQGYDIAYGLDTVLVIQPKALTVSGTTVADKTYDGNTGAEVSLGTVSGWVNDERLNISAIGTFDNKNAGTAKQVEVAYTLNDGSNGGLASNYRLTDGNSYTAAIEPKALTITATNASKTQGETLQLNGSTGFVVGSGLVDGESIDQVELASPGAGAEADAGAHDIIASAASGSNGFDADNYTITYQKGTLTVIASSGSGTGGNPGGGSNPGDNGGGSNPGDNGSGSNPSDNGSGSNPGDNGGGSNPGDNGGGSNPGDNGSGGNPGDNGGGSNPGENGGGSNPGDNGGGGNPGDTGGTSEGESARQPNVPIPSGGALWLAQQTTEDERLARNRMAALEPQREDRVPYLTLTPEFIRVPGPEGGEGGE